MRRTIKAGVATVDGKKFAIAQVRASRLGSGGFARRFASFFKQSFFPGIPVALVLQDESGHYLTWCDDKYVESLVPGVLDSIEWADYEIDER